jgi:UDP-N-acetylglucosamine 1-carboxyvinyltransferase
MAGEKFIIKGGKPLKGEVEIKGAKNAAFPVLAAALLTEKPCVVGNLPLIEDVFRMLNVLEALGAKISWLEERKVEINSSDVNPLKIPFDIVNFFRGSILLVGPLLARFNEIKVPPPGGCLIGARPVDTHLDAFAQLGVKIFNGSKKYLEKGFIKPKSGFYHFQKSRNFKQRFQTASGFKERKRDNFKEVVLREFSVTATENVLLFSVLSKQKTILKMADRDYQVEELIKVLQKMGAEIKELDSHSLEISGQDKLNGFEHDLISDPIETGTFIIAALATKGEVVVEKAQLSFLDLFLKRLKDFGARFKILDKETIKILPSRKLKMDKIQSLPYPGLHSDLQPELGILATQAKGPTLIHDPLYESRLKYLEGLNKMGADIIFCDPHRAIVYGPTDLIGIRFASPDLRAGAALVIAGLIAKGETIIDNIYQIDRGYERIEKRLRKLGANIRRTKE